MREIKFRSWDKREMLEVKSIHLGTQKIIVGCKYGNMSIPFENVELMQYTGLKDKNGKEIYEGDILRTEIEDNQYRNYHVKFDEKELSYELYGNDDLPYRICCTSCNQELFEVIGNIYENPELIEGDAEC